MPKTAQQHHEGQGEEEQCRITCVINGELPDTVDQARGLDAEIDRGNPARTPDDGTAFQGAPEVRPSQGRSRRVKGGHIRR